VPNICRIINTQAGWTPGTSECLSFKEICEYWNIIIHKWIFELDMNHDFNKFIDSCVYDQRVLMNISEQRLRDYFDRQKNGWRVKKD